MKETAQRNPMITRLGALGSLLLLGGCAVISIGGHDGTVKVERHFGVLSISFAEPDQGYVAEVKSLGFVNTPLGFTAGYGYHNWIILPRERCQVVLWLEGQAQRAVMQPLLESSRLLCADDLIREQGE